MVHPKEYYRQFEKSAMAKKAEDRTREERLAIKYKADREMNEYFDAEDAEKKLAEETRKVVEARTPLKPAKERFKLAPPGTPSIGDEMLPEVLSLPKKEKDPLGASVVNLTPVLNAIAAKPSNVEKAGPKQSKTQGPVPPLVRQVRKLKSIAG